MSMKWMRGYGGTRFVWNLVMSALSAPSKRSDAVSDADRVDAATRRTSHSALLLSAVAPSNDTDNGRTALACHRGARAVRRVANGEQSIFGSKPP